MAHFPRGKLFEQKSSRHISESNFLIVDRSGLKSAAINFFSLSPASVAINSNYRAARQTKTRPLPLLCLLLLLHFCCSATFHEKMFRCQMLDFFIKKSTARDVQNWMSSNLSFLYFAGFSLFCLFLDIVKF